MGISTEALLHATQLTRQGRLSEATRIIQQALGFKPATNKPARRQAAGATDVGYREARRSVPALDGPAQVPPPACEASFTAQVFPFNGHRYRYRVFEPQRPEGTLLPVVVMLHGCKQSSEDFARGTRMNEMAAREGFLVLYPEQLRKANQMGCWNWFDAQNQARGSGEPAMIVALVQAVVRAHGGDPQRVYVAGLSAGGAMAATLGELYPDVFAAIGVHSGLPPAAAHDVPSAFEAMRKGSRTAASRAAGTALPTIVFHGTSDRTVAPANGEAILQRQIAAHAGSAGALTRSESRGEAAADKRERPSTRVQWRDASGKLVLESWKVSAGPHAWSGGSAAGSFTDPQGPSASAAMAAFFLQHRKG